MAFQSSGSPKVGSMWIAELAAGAGSKMCGPPGSRRRQNETSYSRVRRCPPAMALGARVGVAVALGLDVALLEQRDDAGGRRALELGLGDALRRAGGVADVGQRGGDADVAAEVGGDDALARLGEGVEQAGEELLELHPQRVRQVGVGHVEPRGGDVVERDRAAPVGVAERLEVALGGHRHAAARLGVGDQLDLGWARRGDRHRRCVVRVHAASPWSWCRHSHDRSSGVNQIGPMQHRLQANVPRLRADSVPSGRVASDRT